MNLPLKNQIARRPSPNPGKPWDPIHDPRTRDAADKVAETHEQDGPVRKQVRARRLNIPQGVRDRLDFWTGWKRRPLEKVEAIAQFKTERLQYAYLCALYKGRHFIYFRVFCQHFSALI